VLLQIVRRDLAARLRCGEPRDVDLLDARQARPRRVADHVVQLHAALENPVLRHRVDRLGAGLVLRVGLGEHDAPARTERAIVAGHRAPAIGNVVKAFVGQHRVGVSACTGRLSASATIRCGRDGPMRATAISR